MKVFGLNTKIGFYNFFEILDDNSEKLKDLQKQVIIKVKIT